MSLCTQTCTHGSLCFVDRYTLLQSSGGTACPLSLVLPLASALPPSSYTYKPQCSTKAAPVQIPSLAPYYLLSKGSMLAAGLQSAELLQASLVLLSQKSLLDGWPLAISERPGEYNGKTPGLGCREWHRQSRWGVLGGKVFCHESNTQSPSGPEETPLISSPLPSSSPRNHLYVPQSKLRFAKSKHSALSPVNLSPALD